MNENDTNLETMGEDVLSEQVLQMQQKLLPDDPHYANAYIPYQQYTGIMSPDRSLACGTAFAELSMPYGGWKTRLSR